MAQETRRGGRSARRAERTERPVRALPALQRRLPLYEVLNEEGAEMIHDASMRILEEIGIDFRDDEAAAMWRDAGAAVDGHRVRSRASCWRASSPRRRPASRSMPATRRAPSRSAATAWSSARTTARPSCALRRRAPLRHHQDLEDLHKLAYLAPALHNTGSVICEPVDVPVAKRHLHITYSAIRHSDKSFMGPVTAPERAVDAVRMAEIVFGDGFVATTRSSSRWSTPTRRSSGTRPCWVP